MKTQDILNNQFEAIRVLQESLKQNKNLMQHYDISQFYSYDLSSNPFSDRMVKANDEIINSLLYQLSVNVDDNSWFNHINGNEIIWHSDYCYFLLSNLRVSDDFLQLLSLKNSIALGTWGRFKVVLPPVQDRKALSKTDRSTDDVLLFVTHCNLHNCTSREQTLTKMIKHYKKMLAKYGIKDIVVHSTNTITHHEDVVYAHSKHPRHEHWSPATTVLFFQKIYEKFPKSIILTHPYVASLLLDNNLFFNFDTSLIVDNEKLVAKSFSRILNYLNQHKNAASLPSVLLPK